MQGARRGSVQLHIGESKILIIGTDLRMLRGNTFSELKKVGTRFSTPLFGAHYVELTKKRLDSLLGS